MKNYFKNKNITTLGLSKSGISCAKYLNSIGCSCIISEYNAETSYSSEELNELIRLGIKLEIGDHKNETILNADIIITSPGIPPHAPVKQLIKENNIEIISEVDVAFLESDKPFIAITGTNGKSTTTKLVSEILTNAGLNAPACGNIGLPVTSLLNTDIDYFVVEVSSYQIDTSQFFRPEVALFLNYSPDHIDWHGSKEEYFKAKESLFTGDNQPLHSVLNAKEPNVKNIDKKIFKNILYFGNELNNNSVFIKDKKIFSNIDNKKQEIISLEEITIPGDHNLQNIMAAVAIACILKIDKDVIKNTIISFKLPEHRLEYVDTIDGIDYYNDSKATNCDSAIVALKAFKDKGCVLIAGGKDKGTSLDEFVQNIKISAKSVVLIGQATERFEIEMKKANYQNIYKVNSLEEAIDRAGSLNLAPVLFSPACASFDMFKNFEERGKVFKDYVSAKKNSKQ